MCQLDRTQVIVCTVEPVRYFTDNLWQQNKTNFWLFVCFLVTRPGKIELFSKIEALLYIYKAQFR